MDFSKPRQADLISLSILLGIRKISSIVKKFKKSGLDGHDGLGNDGLGHGGLGNDYKVVEK